MKPGYHGEGRVPGGGDFPKWCSFVCTILGGWFTLFLGVGLLFPAGTFKNPQNFQGEGLRGDPPMAQASDEWRIYCPKEGDQVKVIPQKEGVILEISSHRGIGQAVVERKDGSWPTPLRVRLCLRGLESLRVEVGQWGLEASVTSHPPYQRRVRVHGPEPLPAPDPKSPYWVEVQLVGPEGKPVSEIPLKGGYFELTIPPIFLKDHPKKMQIHWIDFYRG